MIDARGLRFARGDRVVVDAVDLVAEPGRVVGIVGPNGSGKTTLLRLLYAALAPLEGEVLIDRDELARLGRREVARRIAVVTQEPDPELPISVAESVLLGRLPHRSALARPSRQDRAVVTACLQRVGAEQLAQRAVTSLSGGERQRVLIARALAQDAAQLLLDEPTNHLDIRYQHETLRLVRELGRTTVVVLHDLNLAAAYCDTLVLLDQGRVVASGGVGEVLVPEVIEPVYGIRVERIDRNDRVHLIFTHPHDRVPTASGADRDHV